MCRKTAQGHSRHRMAQGIKPAHAGNMQGYKGRSSCQCIGKPQSFGHLRNTGSHLAFFIHTRNFRFEKLRPPHAQHRQNCHSQHDNTHTAKPVEHVPPKIHRRCQRIQAGNHCCPRCRQPRHRFKKRIGETHGRHIEINRHRRHDGKGQPQHQYQGKSVTRPQFTVETQSQHPSNARHQQYRQSRIGKHDKRAVVIKIRHQCRHCQQQ